MNVEAGHTYESTWEMPSDSSALSNKNFSVLGAGKTVTVLTVGPQNYGFIICNSGLSFICPIYNLF
jgi:hypothetical protein